MPGLRPAIDLLAQAIAAFRRDRMQVHAAALAFRTLLSLFPFIVFLLALPASFAPPDFFASLGRHAQLVLPAMARGLIEQVVAELQMPGTGLLSTSTVVALWLASGAMRSLMDSLNLVFRARESRPAWKRYPLSLLLTVGLALLLIVATVLLSVGPRAMRSVADLLGFENAFVQLWYWLRIPAAATLLVLGVAIAYYLLPNVEHGFRLFSPGAVLAVLAWLCGSMAFGFYVQNFRNYSLMYGSIGALIVLLLNLYLATTALLFGAELNAASERRRRQAGQR